jgi:hypothetical protein
MGLIYLLNMHCTACFDSILSANTMYEMFYSTPSIMLIKLKPQILVFYSRICNLHLPNIITADFMNQTGLCMAGMIEMKNAHIILDEISEGNRPFQRYCYRLGVKVKSHC